MVAAVVAEGRLLVLVLVLLRVVVAVELPPLVVSGGCKTPDAILVGRGPFTPAVAGSSGGHGGGSGGGALAGCHCLRSMLSAGADLLD